MAYQSTFIARMKHEYLQLNEKIESILQFKETEKYFSITPQERMMLTEQLCHMNAYRSILIQRINYYEKGNQKANL